MPPPSTAARTGMVFLLRCRLGGPPVCCPELVLWAFSSSSGEVAGTAQQKSSSEVLKAAGSLRSQAVGKIQKTNSFLVSQ